MMTRSSVRALAAPTFVRPLTAAFVFLVFAGFAAAQGPPLKVAVYDAPPYGHVEPDGSVEGVSVDLWRRVAESLGREYHLVPVAQMEAVLQGLERKDYDVAIGAITITPARLARVDFSYPTHRSGAAVAVRQDTGPMAALASYGSVLGELAPLIALTFALLIGMGGDVDRRTADAASQPRVRRRHFARRRLLGRRDDDDGARAGSGR
jgi:ABC-type amino acid transport substrate-binding protein